MKKIIFATLSCLIGLSTMHAQTAAPPSATHAQPRIGILLLAHGGSVQTWDEDVRHVADQVDLSVPTEVAFGMATRSSMQAAVNRLVARKVTAIVAVPLFINSHSSLIDSISYLLGLRSQQPEDLKMFAMMDNGAGGMAMDHSAMKHDPSEAMKPVTSAVPIRMASALDHHRIVADILNDRAASISHDPTHEVVVLVAHGPVEDEENNLWLHDMSILADEMRSQSHYAGIEFMTLRDDADKSVRDAATQQLRGKVEKITQSGNTALIVPLLLSYGGIEGGLRDRLNDLTYRMSSQGLLPDKRIANWVLATTQTESSSNPAQK
ncbi:hypothetical protein GOB94_07235 [Granulicella sp. 5B5]|uniref:sirohydrochlorin chelatase n=1 Tax=Granulicella sp. 5B5 TaxID=1617967 RepID=UPI0015F5CF42|nr:CbiX/SirB N-terminal domain-containing protein [Granulicella sp. 5B5]QMV18501.1 hypothetical protein GOB94_07235 [Granulicella sp. 5B5]